MFAGLDRLETNKGNLERGQSPENVKGRVSNIDFVGEAAHEHQGEDVQGNQVDDKGVPTPRNINTLSQ